MFFLGLFYTINYYFVDCDSPSSNVSVDMHVSKKSWLMPQLLKEIQIVKSFNFISLEINLIHIPNLKIQLQILLRNSKVPGYLKSCFSWTYMEELFECCSNSLTVFRLVLYAEQDLSQVKIMFLLGDEMAGHCFWHDSCQIQLSERQQ